MFRVPNYTYDDVVASAFEELIALFECTIEAMVFDQVANPGGSIFHVYAILFDPDR